MKRIIVIGCPGSGKSTFAKALQGKLHIPLHHLDMIYWRADGSFISKDELEERLREIMAKDEWIIDGNYGSTMEMRFEKCDTIFFLDYPTEICLAGVMDRSGKPRSDMPFQSPDGADEEFVGFIKSYNETSRPKVISLLEKHSDKKAYVFKSRDEADAFLDSVE